MERTNLTTLICAVAAVIPLAMVSVGCDREATRADQEPTTGASQQSDTTAAAAVTDGEASPKGELRYQEATPAHHHQQLVKLVGLQALPAHETRPLEGHPDMKFRIGAFTEQAAWDSFVASAQVKTAGFPAIDFGEQAVLFVILDAQTNALGFEKWETAAGGAQGRLTFTWSGIEPLYTDATPAVFAVVERPEEVVVTSEVQGRDFQERFEL